MYVVGRAPAHPRDLTTLALEHIRAFTPTDETFTVDPALDPKRYETEGGRGASVQGFELHDGLLRALRSPPG